MLLRHRTSLRGLFVSNSPSPIMTSKHFLHFKTTTSSFNHPNNKPNIYPAPKFTSSGFPSKSTPKLVPLSLKPSNLSFSSHASIPRPVSEVYLEKADDGMITDTPRIKALEVKLKEIGIICGSFGPGQKNNLLCPMVMMEALSKSGSKKSAVRAVCLGVSGVNHPNDQERILNWLSEIFPRHVKLYVQNDAVAALASGSMGKLHGCVLIAGTGSIAYGFSEDGKEARAAGGGPVLGDWGSGYGIAAQALTSVVRAHDGRGPHTMLTNSILKSLSLSSPDELIGWTYADPSWARIAALVPVVVSCAEAGDGVANQILNDAVEELAVTVKAVVQRLGLCGADGSGEFPIVLVGGVLTDNKNWDIGQKVVDCLMKTYPGAFPVRPKVEPAIGAALLACNFYMKENNRNGVI